jgi:hypothetical protein
VVKKMRQFYLRERKDTIAYKQAPALPAGFFGKKKNNEVDEIEQQYNEQQANAFANVEDEQMLMTLKGGEF